MYSIREGPNRVRPIYPPLPDRSYALGSKGFNFGGAHPGGTNILLADGAVRFLRFDIDRTTFNRLGDKADGQVLGNF